MEAWHERREEERESEEKAYKPLNLKFKELKEDYEWEGSDNEELLPLEQDFAPSDDKEYEGNEMNSLDYWEKTKDYGGDKLWFAPCEGKVKENKINGHLSLEPGADRRFKVGPYYMSLHDIKDLFEQLCQTEHHGYQTKEELYKDPDYSPNGHLEAQIHKYYHEAWPPLKEDDDDY